MIEIDIDSELAERVRCLVEEAAAEEAARLLGAAIHEACGVLARQGGDIPFDGVMSIVYGEVLRREGWVPVGSGKSTEVGFPVAVMEP